MKSARYTVIAGAGCHVPETRRRVAAPHGCRSVCFGCQFRRASGRLPRLQRQISNHSRASLLLAWEERALTRVLMLLIEDNPRLSPTLRAGLAGRVWQRPHRGCRRVSFGWRFGGRTSCSMKHFSGISRDMHVAAADETGVIRFV